MAHLHLGRCLLRWICQLQNDGHRRRSPCKVWPHHAASCWTVGPWGRWAVGPLGDTSWTDSVSESSLGTWCHVFIWFNSMTLDDSFWRRWDRHEPFRYTAQRVRVELKFNWPRWETEWDRARERDFMMFWRQCAWLVPSCDSRRIV